MNNQPLHNQFTIEFNGPIHKDSQVNELSELLNMTHNYKHKLVWVTKKFCFYYLKEDCDGTQIEHWLKYGSNATVLQHQNVIYEPNIAVHKEGNIYISLQEVPENIDVTNTDYWERINGNIKVKILFDDMSEWIINTTILNPSIEVYVNDELVEACIIKNQNNTYSVKFISNDEFISQTGYVYIY